MRDILEDIETRMFALDRALPDNSAARDLLEILHRCQAEIGQLRHAIDYALAELNWTESHARREGRASINNDRALLMALERLRDQISEKRDD
jgi:hypothetical protein